MCGRVRCALQPDRIRKYVEHHCIHEKNQSVRLEEDEFRMTFTPSYNIGPGKTYRLPVAMASSSKNSSHDGGEVVVAPLVWGLVPSFQKGTPDFFKMFNCRSETMCEKPSFRRLVSRNRCIVFTEGFYEWKHSTSLGKETKQPYFIHFKDASGAVSIMPMAGLYDCWKDTDGNLLRTCTIVTTPSNSDLAWLHDRMPLILSSDAAQREWLDPKKDGIAKGDIEPYHGKMRLAWYPVTPKMGKVSCQGPVCSEKLKDTQQTLFSSLSLAKKRQQQQSVKKEEEGEEESSRKRIKTEDVRE